MLVYEYTLKHLCDKKEDDDKDVRFRRTSINPLHTAIAGALAGMASWVPAVPFDVVKTRMMTEPDPKRFRGVWHCLRVIQRVSWYEKKIEIDKLY